VTVAQQQAKAPAHPPLMVPVGLVVASIFLMVLFQTVQLVREEGALTQLKLSQESTVQESVKLRQQLETLAGNTAQLARDGDTAARSVVDDMRRQGVNLSPPAAKP
jgi:hypothetical protein